MLWILLFVLLLFWILKFGFGLGGWWIPVLMMAGWLFFIVKLFIPHEQS